MRLFVFVIVTAGVIGCAATANDKGTSQRFDTFRCWLAGDWDNLQQAQADVAAGVNELRLHPRRAMRYVPISNAHLDGQLFAIHNYTQRGFDGPLDRISLHRFRSVGDGIAHEFLFLLDKQRWGDLSADLRPLQEITPDDVRINADCAMHWYWHDGYFEGSTIQGLCVTSSFTDHPIRVEGHGELRPDRLLRHDRNFTLLGEPLPIPGGATPERFDKVGAGQLPDVECGDD